MNNHNYSKKRADTVIQVSYIDTENLSLHLSFYENDEFVLRILNL